MVALVAVMAGPAVGRPASAQVVIGDDRPAVTVDQGVLDRLGTEKTLPDLFLGRQVSSVTPSIDSRQYRNTPSPTRAPVLLHRPLHKAVVRHIHKAKPAAATVTKVAASVPVRVVEARNDGGKPESDTPKPAEPAVKQAPPAPAATAATVPAPPSEPIVTPPDAIAQAQAPAQAQAQAQAPAATRTDMAPMPITSRSSPPPAKLEAPPPPPAQIVTAPAPPAPPLAAPPPPMPAAAASPAPTPLTPPPAQEARLPPPDGATSILFEKDQARLPDDARAILTQLAGRLAAETAMEVQLLAYAEGDENSASKARRLSLSRALAVRSFLIDQGVRSARIEVRALGNKVSDGPSDRVDLVVQKH